MSNYEQHPQKSPIETITSVRPFQTVEFLDGTTSVRNILSGRQYEGSAALVPLRGAMPIIWAAQGLHHEASLPVEMIELPIGLFHYVNRDGKLTSTSPNYEQKYRIVERILESRRELGKRLLILDEVQKGGTISTLIQIIQQLSHKGVTPPHLNIIAAQDSRQPILRQAKTCSYRSIASNSVSGLKTNVVPMPLIATDRGALLDSIDLRHSNHTLPDIGESLVVSRNQRAEHLIRSLGSMARDEELRHDAGFIAELVGSQGRLSESAAAKVEFWLPKVIDYLDGLARKNSYQNTASFSSRVPTGINPDSTPRYD